MKKTILALLFLVIIGCNKNNHQPSTTATTSTSNNTNTSNLTSYEQTLIGRWLADSHVIYNGGVRIYVIPQVDTNTCRINFYSTEHIIKDNHKNGDFGYLSCNLQTNCSWKCPSAGIITIQGITNGVMLLTPTKLILTRNGDRYYLHR